MAKTHTAKAIKGKPSTTVMKSVRVHHPSSSLPKMKIPKIGNNLTKFRSRIK